MNFMNRSIAVQSKCSDILTHVKSTPVFTNKNVFFFSFRKYLTVYADENSREQQFVTEIQASLGNFDSSVQRFKRKGYGNAELPHDNPFLFVFLFRICL